MRTRIISAFPGTGKSIFHKNNSTTTLDSDSSKFSWTYVNGEKERHPAFPFNYINHIKKNIGRYEFIFVSSHEVVRKALLDNSIFFYWVCPDRDRKEEFIQRYKDRGNEEGFVKLLETKWNDWMAEFYLDSSIGMKKINMTLPYLSDELNHIIRSENGDIKYDQEIEGAKTYDSPAVIYTPPLKEDGIEIELPIYDDIEDPPIPKDLDEAIKILTNEHNIKFAKDDLDEDNFKCALHHGFGTSIRNNWGLWEGSDLQRWFKERGIHHPDDMSSIILTSVYREIMDEPRRLDEQIKLHRDFWDKSDPSVNKGEL